MRGPLELRSTSCKWGREIPQVINDKRRSFPTIRITQEHRNRRQNITLPEFTAVQLADHNVTPFYDKLQWVNAIVPPLSALTSAPGIRHRTQPHKP